MATSAAHISDDASAASPGNMAIPMLAPTLALIWCRRNGLSTSVTRRWATSVAAPSSTSISTTPSSSPPRRTTVPRFPTTADRRGPSWRSSSSPAGWPKESLISLKWFRSTKRNARRRGAPGFSASPAKKVSSTWVSWRRLPSPVSSSVLAWRWRSSVITRRLRAEIARRTPTRIRVAIARSVATSETCWLVATTMMASAATEAIPGMTIPAVRSSRRGSAGRGATQTDIDMRMIADGQAAALKSAPKRVAS